MSFVMILQLLIVLAALYVGSRYGSLALGAISGIGLAILVLGFGMKPGNPPTDVIYIIIAAVTCAGIMQAAGGMDWLIQLAEKLLRKHPEHITFLAPLCTFFLTVLVGTGHVVYTLMPIICDISLKKGIRPERPCGVASVASQVGITCSPIAAAVASFVIISNDNGFDINNLQVIAVTIPACVCGLMAAALCSYKRGKDLDKDPVFQERKANPKMYKYMYGETASLLDKEVTKSARMSVYIFLGALLVITLYSFFQIIGHDIRPKVGEKYIGMNIIIQIVMITAAALMWLADTYFSNYLPMMQDGLQGIVSKYPWAIALAFFAVSVLVNSQGAVVVAMLPLAYSLGIPGPVLLGVLPSVYGYFFIPNYPSDIATVTFDRSGTTRIGKYLLNHSFMMPGLVSVITSTIVATLITRFIY